MSNLVLLNRLLALKESSPFLLVLDSLAQLGHYLVDEFAHKAPGPIIYVSYETASQPPYATVFIDGLKDNVVALIKAAITDAPRTLVIVDSLNYIGVDHLTTFVPSIILPKVSVVGVFHTDVPQRHTAGSPLALSVLSFIASSIFEVDPLHEVDEATHTRLGQLQFAVGLNEPRFRLRLTNRRKSGRSLTYDFVVDTTTHEYEILKKEVEPTDDDELLKDLTTFNLTTNSKQRLAREQVELPFMEAQQALGLAGGAIVYEFEKDDDYDEEDPYEDPF